MSGHHHGSVLLADEQVSIDLSNMEPRQQMMQSQALIYDETVSYSVIYNYFFLKSTEKSNCKYTVYKSTVWINNNYV